MKCKPCSISFPSSVDLIHHVFNDHNFQPTIELDHVESVDEVLTKYINTTQKKKRNRIPAKPKGKRFLRIKRDLTKMWKSEKKVPIVLKLFDIGPLFFFYRKLLENRRFCRPFLCDFCSLGYFEIELEIFI